MKQRVPTTLSAKIRAYFGLSQLDLSCYLGVSRPLVVHAETGRCDYGSGTWRRLLPLATQVPPPVGAGPEEEAPEMATLPDAALLRQHLRQCEHAAGLLRYALEEQEQTRLHARRWLRALPELQAELPADPAGDDRYQQRSRRWLEKHSADMADVLRARPSTERRLQLLRLRLLEEEAAEIRRWLSGTSGTPVP